MSGASARVALDNSDCIASTMHFGWTHYVDICGDRTADVPWGGAGWMIFFVLSAIGIGLAFMAIGMGWSILRDFN